MSKPKIPLLLSFYALSNGRDCTVLGQLTLTGLNDLSFINYSRRRTFRTLLRLYRTKPFANQSIRLIFDVGEIQTSTNSFGAFYVKEQSGISGSLKEVLLSNGETVRTIEGLYDLQVHVFNSRTIVVSDIDDTLVHSYIYRKIKKFRTLMFTTLEKRKAVVNMQELVQSYINAGAEPVYLSNSEQNLHPVIYRFLRHNKFPKGPLFLKQLRSLWDVILNIKFPLKDSHKINILENVISQFSERKFILMGDNTQHDLSIYIKVARKYPGNISAIIIRKVVDQSSDNAFIEEAKDFLAQNNITLHYATSFPLYAKPDGQS